MHEVVKVMRKLNKFVMYFSVLTGETVLFGIMNRRACKEQIDTDM